MLMPVPSLDMTHLVRSSGWVMRSVPVVTSIQPLKRVASYLHAKHTGDCDAMVEHLDAVLETVEPGAVGQFTLP